MNNNEFRITSGSTDFLFDMRGDISYANVSKRMYTMYQQQTIYFTYKDEIHVKLSFSHFFLPKDCNNHEGQCAKREEIGYRPHEDVYLLCLHCGCVWLTTLCCCLYKVGIS